MAELTFGCTGAHVVRYAATPTFALSLNITESTGVRLHAIALRCQIRIEPQQRPYTADEARRLGDLFGDSARLAEAAEPLQLATLSALVPGFTARTELQLPVPCSYDLEVASARYLQALDEGVIPLLLLFSGTVFVDHGHTYGVELIPWSIEVPFRMPVRVWHDVIDEHFPGSAWLRCSRETIDALAEFKSAYALPTWDATLSALLEAASVPWDAGLYPEAVGGTPQKDAEPDAGSAAPEATAAEPADTGQEPRAAAGEAHDTAEATAGAAPEAPEPALEPPVSQEAANATAEPEAGAPEVTSTVVADIAAAETEQEPAAAAAEPQDTSPEPEPEPEPETEPEPEPEPEPRDSTPDPEDAAPAEPAAEERHAGTGRRRTGTAARRPAVRRAGGRRAGGTS